MAGIFCVQSGAMIAESALADGLRPVPSDDYCIKNQATMNECAEISLTNALVQQKEAAKKLRATMDESLGPWFDKIVSDYNEYSNSACSFDVSSPYGVGGGSLGSMYNKDCRERRAQKLTRAIEKFLECVAKDCGRPISLFEAGGL
jgi:hypothetical protein